MEYYLYRNGSAYLACTFADADELASAQGYLGRMRQAFPQNEWFMEDEDSREVIA